MKRVSNRQHQDKTQVHYIERLIPGEPEIQYVEKEIPMSVDLSGIHAHISKHEQHLTGLQAHFDRGYGSIYAELEMQRRALVGIKQQRDVDRKRRLQLIVRLKKQQDTQRQLNYKYKFALGACLALSLLSLIIKL